MASVSLQISPKDDGRRMSLDDFEGIEAEAGYCYELARGIIAVTEIPHPRHLAQVDLARDQFVLYRALHPGRIFRIAGSGECKILLAQYESERHLDLAIYKTPPPDEEIWATWIPEIVLEFISPGSEHRDYVEKREEYLQFGVKEYWILNAQRQEMLALRRSKGQWTDRIVTPPALYRTPLLPEFEFACGPVFAAAVGRLPEPSQLVA